MFKYSNYLHYLCGLNGGWVMGDGEWVMEDVMSELPETPELPNRR